MSVQNKFPTHSHYFGLCIEVAYQNIIPGAAPFMSQVDLGIFNLAQQRGGLLVPLAPVEIESQKFAFDEEK